MKEASQTYDLIVVGGGAAGFFGAIRAAELAPGARVAILEGSAKTLNKVRISGGGRCNVTHACWDPAELVTHYPRGEKELLGPFHRFAPGDTLDWFAQRGVDIVAEADGRMFPATNTSETIASCLEQQAQTLGIDVHLQQRITQVLQTDGRFRLSSRDGNSWESRYLLVATGSQPAMWEALARLGHQIVPPVPSLFTFHLNNKGLKKLSGVSVPDAAVRAEGIETTSSGPLLITHEGLSGPAVLKLSAWGARGFHEMGYQTIVIIDWLGKGRASAEHWIAQQRMEAGGKAVDARSQLDLPGRLWSWMVARSDIAPGTRWADLTKGQGENLAENLSECRLQMTGKSTFKEEFVTAGGVDLKELDFRRFESKIAPGLFLAGEVLNMDAVTGGFNFQAAWTGGWLAGSEIGKSLRG